MAFGEQRRSAAVTTHHIVVPLNLLSTWQLQFFSVAIANLHGNDPNQGRGDAEGAHAHSACWSLACSPSCSEALAPRQGEGAGTGQAGPWGAAGAHGVAGTGVCEGLCLGLAHLTHFSASSLQGANCWFFTASPRCRQGRQLELLLGAMAPVRSEARLGLLLLSALSLLSAGLVAAAQDPGTAIPAESRYLLQLHLPQLHPVLPALLHCPQQPHGLPAPGEPGDVGLMMGLCHGSQARESHSHRNSMQGKH